MSDNVAVEIRYKFGTGARWVEFKRLAEDDGFAFGWADGAAVSIRMNLYEVRPIRTAEEVAVDEIRNSAPTYVAESVARHIYAAIRDGKIPGVKLEDGE